jgi:hypothetical protein
MTFAQRRNHRRLGQVSEVRRPEIRGGGEYVKLICIQSEGLTWLGTLRCWRELGPQRAGSTLFRNFV